MPAFALLRRRAQPWHALVHTVIEHYVHYQPTSSISAEVGCAPCYCSASAMAIVLDGIRGMATKELTHIIGMPDEEYAFYQAEVKRLPLNQQMKWKRRNEKSDGSTQTTRYDGPEFYTRWLNQRVSVKSVSMIAELERFQRARPSLHGLICKGNCQCDLRRDGVPVADAWHAEIDRLHTETRTGNHQPRNHPTRVPTRAGEPVRG